MRLLVLALAVLAAGCARTPAQAPPPAEVLVAVPPSALLQRADLQHLAERTARRDTAALVAALTSEDPVLRARAAFGLGSVQAASAVPGLLALLADPHPAVRAEAAFALGQTPDERVPGPLLDALRAERDPTVRERLLTALGQTGNRAHLGALVTMALPASADAARALALARFGLRRHFDPGATAWLAERLTAADPETRRHAAYLFGRMRDAEGFAPPLDRLAAASEALAPDDPAQASLALALGAAEPLAPALARLLGSPDWRVRVNAVRALGARPRPPEALALLLARLDDPSPHVAAEAASALAARPLDDEPLAAASAWLADAARAPWTVRVALLPALARAGRAGAVMAALDALPDDPYPRAAGIAALGPLDDPAARRRLADAASDPDARVAYAALAALRTRWQAERSADRAPAYFELFAQALRRADVATVYAAAPALSDSLFFALGAADVLRDTYAALELPRDVEPMVAIVSALGVARDTTTLTFLLGIALHADHPVLRRAATDALDVRFGEGVDFEPTGGRRPAFPAFDWRFLERLGAAPRMVLETDRGTVTLVLDPHRAPLTVQSIARLANAGRYDGVPFHRVVPNFVVQGGDFARADGFGSADYFLPSEFSAAPYRTGTLGMASAGKDTEGSQFFVTHAPQPHLDGRYTVFGAVVEGQDVIDALTVGDVLRRARVLVTE